MTRDDIIIEAAHFTETSAYNLIPENASVSDSADETKIFEPPLFAFGNTVDEYFTLLKKPSVIGDHFLTPAEWLPEAKTVISFFLPFSGKVKKSNRNDMSWPSTEWLYGRIEGQEFVNRLALHIKTILNGAGYAALIPARDKRFSMKSGADALTGPVFTSNWSERHVAYVCGIGTFGLSKGLITEKGVAGRIGSVITGLELPYDVRKYNDIYGYCTMCGVCINNCPAGAISMERGKDHKTCSDFLDITAGMFSPRYGCGKCQVAVPCESRIPLRKITPGI